MYAFVSTLLILVFLDTCLVFTLLVLVFLDACLDSVSACLVNLVLSESDISA